MGGECEGEQCYHQRTSSHYLSSSQPIAGTRWEAYISKAYIVLDEDRLPAYSEVRSGIPALKPPKSAPSPSRSSQWHDQNHPEWHPFKRWGMCYIEYVKGGKAYERKNHYNHTQKDHPPRGRRSSRAAPPLLQDQTPSRPDTEDRDTDTLTHQPLTSIRLAPTHY